jgi:hypothetical protein
MDTGNHYLKNKMSSRLMMLVFSIGFALVTSASTLAIEDICPVIVQSAMDATNQSCTDMGQDQACYGHVMVNAVPYSGSGTLTFAEPGDIADVISLRSLRLSAMDVESGIWGLARMELRANTPRPVAENVTVLMFGDVDVNNAIEPSSVLDATVSVPDYVNVRLWPSEKGGVLGTLAPDQSVRVVGRLTDSSWLRVELPDSGAFGWLYAPLLTVTGDVETLPVEKADTPHYGPMKAFYFQDHPTDEEIEGCATVPPSGLLIQTPEGAGQVTFLINEVDIRIGSTVFFQAQPLGDMTISTIEGAARIQVNGVQSTAFAGTQVRIPLDENLSPIGSPTSPEPYDEEALKSLPLGALNKPVVVMPPASPSVIQDFQTPPDNSEPTEVLDPTNTTTGDDGSGTGGDVPGTGGDVPGIGGDVPDIGGDVGSTPEITEQPVSSPKDACKDGGWETMTDGDGNPFKNQGDCVSYFS